MLRIHPAHPPLWRSADTLQFGVEAVAVIDDPATWQQRLVRELEHGMPDGAVVPFAVAAGASARAAEKFLDDLGLALMTEEREPPAVRVQAAGAVPQSHLRTVAQAMASSGCRVHVAHEFDEPGAGMTDAATLVVVAHRLVPPSFAARLMADDVPHLPVVIGPDRSEIGPRIVPGHTACLACQAAHRREADDAWPAIAAQLLGRCVGVVDESMIWEARDRGRADARPDLGSQCDGARNPLGRPLDDAPRRVPAADRPDAPTARRVPLPISRRKRDG